MLVPSNQVATMKLPIRKPKEARKAIGFRLPESKAKEFEILLNRFGASIQETLESAVDMILAGKLTPDKGTK